jgi:hypothetical protein
MDLSEFLGISAETAENLLHSVGCYTNPLQIGPNPPQIDGKTGLEAATRLVERHFYGKKGAFARQSFDYINAQFFDNRLPWTLIIWTLTAHGHCLAFTSSGQTTEPIIGLHPSLLGGTESDSPWGFPPELLGYCFAYDSMVHECIHVSVEYLLGGAHGPSSHNCPEWISEVNRIAPLLGFTGIEAGMSKTKRVAVDGTPTRRGKQPSKVVRVDEGNVPFALAVAGFPRGLRYYLKQLDFYKRNILPFALEL